MKDRRLCENNVDRSAIRIAIDFKGELSDILEDVGLPSMAEEIAGMSRELKAVLERRPADSPEMGF